MSRSQTAEERFDARNVRDPETGCWTWIGTMGSSGYGHLRVHARITQAHRYSYDRFIGPIPKGIYVCHSCDNPKCVNPSHLFLGDQKANMADMSSKGRGRQPRGPENYNTKLSIEQARGIKTLLGVKPRSEIARIFGTTHYTVNHIAQGRTWAWLDKEARI